MNNDFIVEKLKELGIYKSDQLIQHDLEYWHLKTFRKNYKNEEKLININNAKEELNKFTDKELQVILENNYIPNKHYKNHEDVANNQNSESFKTPKTKIKENLETIEGVPLNQSKDEKNNVYDTNLNLRNTSKVFLFLIFAIFIFAINPFLFFVGLIIFLIFKVK